MQGKTVLVINGRGGAGKDTLCDFAAAEYPVMNVSAITPIKEMAAMAGWNGEKTDAARRFLSDLKQLTVDYCDYPTKWLLERYREFSGGNFRLMFVHIREGSEIDKFVSGVRELGGSAATLLIRRGEARHYGNASDDNVEQYDYDYIYCNDMPLEEAGEHFLRFLREEILEK